MRASRQVSRSALACSAGTILLSVVAASAPDTAWAQAREPVTISEVVVTASKRAENLQDVDSAITAFTSEMRDTTGIITAQQQLNFTPGVTFNPGQDRVTIRGIGRLTTQLGTDQGVAVYSDGFYTGSVLGAGGIGESTLLTERVEVLRGPQGTLYGRNSVGGAINSISRRPSATSGGEGRAAINSYGGLSAEARVTGPLTEALSAAVTFNWYDQEEGYYKNTAGGPDEGGVAKGWDFDAQLSFRPNDSFDAWLRYSTLDSTTRPRNSTGITDYGVPARGEGTPYVFFGLPAGGNPGVDDHRKFRTNIPTVTEIDDYHQVIGDAVWHASNFDVKYTGGYRTYESRTTFDGNAVDNEDFLFPYDCVTLLGGNAERIGDLDIIEDCDVATPGVQRQYAPVHNNAQNDTSDIRTEYSHELNIASTHDGPLQYIAGLYYFNGRQQQDYHIISLDEPGNNRITVPGSQAPRPTADESLIYAYDTTLKTVSEAIYGQLDYQFTPELKATLGLRGSRDTKEGHEEGTYVYWLVTGIPAGALGPGSPFIPNDLVGGSCIPGPQVAGVPAFYRLDPRYACPIGRDLKRTYKAASGTVSLQWTPNDDRLVYGKYSRGYKSGGYNLGSLLADPFVGSEYLDAFEVGWKENLGSLQFNAAAFFYQYKGMQATNSRIQGTIVLSQLVNLPKVETYGLELEAIWRPTERATILVNYGYLHSEIKEACCFSDGTDPLALQPGAKPVGPLDVGATRDLQPQTLVGNQLAGSPEHKLAVNASYTWDLGGGDLTGSATFNYTGESYQTLFNTPLHRIKGGTSTDLRLTWTHMDSGVSVIGAVTNLFDEEVVNGFVTLTPQNLSFQSIYLEPPRIYTLEVRYVF